MSSSPKIVPYRSLTASGRRWKCSVLSGFFVLTALSAPAFAAADDAAPDCASTPAILPPGLLGWTKPVSRNAATAMAQIGAAPITPGEAVAATLYPTPDVRYVVMPEKPGGSVSYGGMFALHVTKAGTYRVALDSAAWIDVLRGKKAIESVGHGRGPICSGIRKMVDFALKPGRYTLQIAANGKAEIQILVAAQE